MSGAPRRWIRLDADWEDSPWLDGLDGATAGCWPRLLCYGKRSGLREGATCRVKALEIGVASRRWRVPSEMITALLEAAVMDGALEREGGDWVIVNWETYQPRDSTAPDRQRKHRALRRDTVTDRIALSRDRDVDVDRDKKKTPRTRARGTALPEDWTPNDGHLAIAKTEGVNIEAEAVAMRDWALANGETKRDWDATFRNWLRRAKGMNGRKTWQDTKTEGEEEHRREFAKRHAGLVTIDRDGNRIDQPPNSGPAHIGARVLEMAGKLGPKVPR